MSVNERVRAVRQAVKMSQVNFAKAIYISNGYLAEIELGNRRVNERHIQLVCSVFGVSKRWLQTGEGVMFNKAPELKLERVVALFKELNPSFQDYALKQIDQLLELQNRKDDEAPDGEARDDGARDNETRPPDG
ncbi:MAG: helix-turn-helix domain-containing protein [Treponema sp.]|jgi:transcriptional regulator with XRE-family HTH domain|nr:helix-turn-helix domain-containing protein [Treponema sp.]